MLAQTNPERPNPARTRLTDLVNPEHPLCQLAGEIDWSIFEHEFGALYADNEGAPAKPIRLLVGLHYLKYAYNHSDEAVVDHLVENAYWQYFCGFEYFLYQRPLHPTTLVKWRRRVGSERMQTLLKETVAAAQRTKLLVKADLDRVNVDTTVQEKAIAFPTDARLLHKLRQKLVAAAQWGEAAPELRPRRQEGLRDAKPLSPCPTAQTCATDAAQTPDVSRPGGA